MREIVNKYIKHDKLPLILNGVAILAIGVAGYFLYSLSQTMISFKNEVASSTKIINQRIATLEADLATTTLTSTELSQKLADQENKSSSFEQSLSGLSGTLGNLEKLSKTDKELLQKYSKVYFLSDNYVPMSLALIKVKYLYDQTKLLQYHTNALPYLERMLDEATSSGVSIQIASAYRSFGAQSSLKNDYLVTYGSGANKFSADQGYSEHQLGTALDLTTTGLATPLAIKFETTPAFNWLNQNAYRFGFILSYNKNNAYYEYEPWHWRFVGVQLATRLHNEGKTFSDMEQREIDKYLVNIFD